AWVGWSTCRVSPRPWPATCGCSSMRATSCSRCSRSTCSRTRTTSSAWPRCSGGETRTRGRAQSLRRRRDRAPPGGFLLASCTPPDRLQAPGREPMSRRMRAACVAAVGATMLMTATTVGTARAAIPYEAEITPGQLRGIPWEPGDPWPAGYWEYLPSNYDEVPPDHRYPLLMTLGGIGTMDTPSTCPNGTEWCTVAQCQAQFDGICRASGRGPAVEIRQGVWDEVARPFLVISMQNAAP